MAHCLSENLDEIAPAGGRFLQILSFSRSRRENGVHICDLRRFPDGVKGFIPACRGRSVSSAAESLPWRMAGCAVACDRGRSSWLSAAKTSGAAASRPPVVERAVGRKRRSLGVGFWRGGGRVEDKGRKKFT
jgi:hypothetical protein